ASRPRVLSLASTTNQSPRILPGLANTVFISFKRRKRVLGPKKAGKCTARGAGDAKRALRQTSPQEIALLGHQPSPPMPLIMRARMESGHLLDSCIGAADRALRSLFAPAQASRPVPGQAPEPPGESPRLSEAERHRAAALMRVNHAGEIAAQALYHGQALVARSQATRELLLKAAREESDHLAWCETRLRELDSRPSLLNPLWYAGSFAIGALAALMGDRTSLGFVVETERQVEGHLDEHLGRLPAGDSRSR